MPVLPLIDLLLLAGTGSLFVGFLLKAVSITTRFQPQILGFSSIDFVLIAGVCMGLALVLAARTWVKLNEGEALAVRRERREERFRREQRELERAAFALGVGDDDSDSLGIEAARGAAADRRRAAGE